MRQSPRLSDAARITWRQLRVSVQGSRLIMQLHMSKSSMHNLLMRSSLKGALRVHGAASAIAAQGPKTGLF